MYAGGKPRRDTFALEREHGADEISVCVIVDATVRHCVCAAAGMAAVSVLFFPALAGQGRPLERDRDGKKRQHAREAQKEMDSARPSPRGTP